MKVLFATDGSAEDQQARDFVASARWPAGSEIELFGVLRPVALAVAGVFVDDRGRDFPRELEYLATSLPRGESVVSWHCAIGEPAEAIAGRARAIEADLILVGSRNRGPLASTILGSVSAGVTDRAPCPVLVARRPRVERIVIVEDGSVDAATASAFVAEWPFFGDAEIEVVTVVDPREPSGDAAAGILAVADEFAADLIVLGSRGHGGLARLFAGSVDRRVLHGAKCSVLIARGSARVVRAHEPTSLGILDLGAPWAVANQ